MSTSALVNEELQESPPPSQPRRVTGLAGVALLLAVWGIVTMVAAALALRSYNSDGIVSTIVGVVLVVMSLYPLWPVFRAFAGDR